jgi:spore coat protein U domain-containing protein, fimbrial subunit CupE1/2/3/6
VSFGTYNVFSTTPTDSTGSVTYSCSALRPSDRIMIDLSKGNSSAFNPRQMRKSGENLNYNLFTDATYTLIWGDNTSGTTHVNIKPDPTGTVTIYGRIPSGSDVSAGSYSDTVIATINF